MTFFCGAIIKLGKTNEAMNSVSFRSVSQANKQSHRSIALRGGGTGASVPIPFPARLPALVPPPLPFSGEPATREAQLTIAQNEHNYTP